MIFIEKKLQAILIFITFVLYYTRKKHKYMLKRVVSTHKHTSSPNKLVFI